jgi:cyclopropane-fatty-acyl-phospholipid synthase
MSTALAETEASTRFLGELFGGSPPHEITFRLADGTSWPDEKPRPATLVLKHAGALREMFRAGTEKGLAEAFLRDDFGIEGDIESAFAITDALNRQQGGWLKSLRSYYWLTRLPQHQTERTPDKRFQKATSGAHSLERDRQAVSFHYDLSNDFFQLWLDRRMIYSCAYFENGTADLEQAQEAKLWHICRKLRLRPGQRLLDIGCGWGGLALFASQHFGVHVTAVTLSERQAELASERVRVAGRTAAVSIQLKDYRELNPSILFDAIVSVGMSEHVGARELPNYFKIAGEKLRPGGVFLNHAIGEGVRSRPRVGPSFIDQYVFPDSDIPPLPVVLQAAESAKLEVRDVENLREHYALTLRHWVRRLEAAHNRARAFVDEASFRVWQLYMAGSAQAFAHGQLAVYQVLLSKSDAGGGSHQPLTRQDWYA